LIWQGKLDEAEALILEALKIDAKLLDPNHPNNAIDYQALLEIERKRGNLDKALAYGRKALDIRLASLGERNAQTIESWRLVGEMLMAQGRWQEARSPLEHSRELAVAVYSGTGEIVAISEGLLALTYSHLGDHSAAMASARAAIAASANKRRVMQRDNSLARALEATAVAIARQPVQDDEALALAFRAMQVVANSNTGAQAVEASARTAARSPAIEALVRRQQDLDRQISAVDRRLSALRSKGTDAEIVAARAALEANRVALDAARREMNEAFPRYGDLANQSIAPLADLQGQAGALRPGEAVVQLMQTRDALYAMVVTPRKAALHTLDLGSEQAAALVGRVRKGLSLEGAVVAADIPAFDLAASHELYRKVVAPLRRDIGKDALLYVSAEGPLASLPLAVLATRPAGGKNPGFADYRRSRFLADELRLATLPSVGALASARRIARPVKSRRPLLAVADPALSGETRVTTLTQFARLRGSGGRNASTVCKLRPLPDTRIEADRLYAALGAGGSTRLLGGDASERKLASLNGEGALADYRVILFATHGLVVGEASSSVEPSLVLTPDAGCDGTAPDGDGLLTASEITALNLDADWVVLSGCNTASPDGMPNAAPLSGLVRSFLYAGARRMLVSHWSVDSAATADLMAGVFSGKDEVDAAALQRAMVAMRKSPGNGGMRAHPAFWGAFVAVGAEP